MTQEKKLNTAGEAASSARLRALGAGLKAINQPPLQRADELAEILLAALSDRDRMKVSALIKKDVDARRLLSRLS